ncbi:MAG: succinate dehydrogenase cytochrome b subunit [Opitutaceae bacterium]|nr:succinate dehydrogenase cytochrome b subunit [Opitutaceae bacterium]
MNLVANLFRASIGKKFLMAVTGAVLLAFVTGHLVGNLQIFSPPDKINGYAHFLQSLGPALWGVRLVLLACVILHIWIAVLLTIENSRAKPEKYDFDYTIRATLASRTLRWTGGVVLAFIVYHLAQFTVGWAQAGEFKTSLPGYTMAADFHLLGFPVVARGQEVHDVYSMVFLGFSHPLVSLFYIVAVGLLSFHLVHGAESMFQTLGWKSGRWAGLLRKVVVLYCVLYFLGNLAIPGAILTGAVKPAPATYAAQKLAAPAASLPAVVQR